MPPRRKSAPAHALRLLHAVFILSAAIHVAADHSRSFHCRFSVGEFDYDLSQLEGPNVLTRTREAPPSTYEDELRFNLCEDLTEVENRAPEDQCPSGSRACLTTINKKEGNDDRITAVVSIATSSSNAETTVLSSPEGVAVTLYGAAYPPFSSISVPQSLNVSLTCAKSTRKPRFISYEDGQVLVEWKSSAACQTTGTPKEEEEEDDSRHRRKGKKAPIENGGGLEFFFLMLILAFVAYFALGAYYNYSTYGPRGWDLIPHRDFWREVPYMLQDVVVHLCSNLRTQRSGRGGYIAV